MRKRIYVAGPITKGDLVDNVSRATKTAVELIRRGYAPLCPQLSVFMGYHKCDFLSIAPEPSPCGVTHGEWLETDLPWVRVCDAVLRLAGESKGADEEVAAAQERGIPVFYDIDDIRFDGDDMLAEKDEDVPDTILDPETLPDSGKREDFSTGSVRDTREGKGRFDLITPIALRRLAVHYERGAKKYGDRNWEKGQTLSRYLDSALRHLNNYREGDRAEDHIIAAAWNLFAFAHTEEKIDAGELPEELRV